MKMQKIRLSVMVMATALVLPGLVLSPAVRLRAVRKE